MLSAKLVVTDSSLLLLFLRKLDLLPLLHLSRYTAFGPTVSQKSDFQLDRARLIQR